MRIYIASKYIEHASINYRLWSTLTDCGFDVFLPQSINIDATTKEEAYIVSDTCYKEIERCNVMLVVIPYRNNVSAEIGYAIWQKRHGVDKKIISYKPAEVRCDEKKKR